MDRIFKVMEWLDDYDQEELIAQARPDWIDLRHGRDFLRETGKYEIVVLHFLFRGGFRQPAAHDAHDNIQLCVSPLSSWAFWRHRLVQTGAKFIFAFGGLAEVGGTFIVNLDGYRSIKVEEEFWVFERL